MSDPVRPRPGQKWRDGGVTFGLREAIILAIVAVSLACAYVYAHVG